MLAREWLLQGQVQGVGLRPKLLRLARRLNLTGWVRNTSQGVIIHIEGPLAVLDEFENEIKNLNPLIKVSTCTSHSAAIENLNDFTILPSLAESDVSTRVPPDLRLCEDCSREVRDQRDRRHAYAFTSCAVCGPRFSLLRAMPYDRSRTEMARFPLCKKCQEEYEHVEDRRCHAQTLACPLCGPQLAFCDRFGQIKAQQDQAVDHALAILAQGEIVALQGVGGFQLLVRADDEAAIKRLRLRKNRPTKPLAILLPWPLEKALMQELDSATRTVLSSPENPIVLIDWQELSPTASAKFKSWFGSGLEQIAPGLHTTGILLPSTPVHLRLMDQAVFPIVCTSGNPSEEPLALHLTDTVDRLQKIADGFLYHNRPISRRQDDSVVRMVAGQPLAIRLGRGYAPMPLAHLEAFAKVHQVPPLIALGGEQKVSMAMWTGQQAILTQHVGDMSHPMSRQVWQETLSDYQRLYQFEAQGFIYDQHPDYFSSRWVMKTSHPCCAVQHHHAHALSCLAEHGRMQETVLAFTWDGTGWGADGTVWGGEVLLVSGMQYKRLACLRPLAMPGGEAAIKEPVRLLWAMLEQVKDQLSPEVRGRLMDHLGIERNEAKIWSAMIENGFHTPLTTSMGRLFDAIGVLLTRLPRARYEGELACRLEAMANQSSSKRYAMHLVEHSAPNGQELGSRWILDWQSLLIEMVEDWRIGEVVEAMADAFHAAVVDVVAQVANLVADVPIVLTGGCFQNRILAERILEKLTSQGREVLRHRWIPPNDGGLAAGQLAFGMLQHVQSGC